mmetsp:Transcript_2510/g.3920  ORF Transcript_2510/g.3920 Transcript_2510/m.3920 type:complete len:140 (-) Transcript_2510:231-650(-)
MKTFTYIILSAIVASAAAINEPVASPTAAIERELAEYERQLGTDVTGAPTDIPPRPTGGSYSTSMSYGKSGKGGKGSGSGSSKGGKGSVSMSAGSYSSGKAGKGSGSGSSKGGKGSYSASMSYSSSYSYSSSGKAGKRN